MRRRWGFCKGLSPCPAGFRSEWTRLASSQLSDRRKPLQNRQIWMQFKAQQRSECRHNIWLGKRVSSAQRFKCAADGDFAKVSGGQGSIRRISTSSSTFRTLFKTRHIQSHIHHPPIHRQNLQIVIVCIFVIVSLRCGCHSGKTSTQTSQNLCQTSRCGCRSRRSSTANANIAWRKVKQAAHNTGMRRKCFFAN